MRWPPLIVAVTVPLVLAAALVFVSGCGGGEGKKKRPVIYGGNQAPTPVSRDRPLTDKEIAKQKREVAKTARGFMRVYLRYQVGVTDKPLYKKLRRYTTLNVYRYLKTNEVRARPAATPEHSRVTYMRVHDTVERGSVRVEVYTRYKRADKSWRGQMFVDVVYDDNRWRVGDIS